MRKSLAYFILNVASMVKIMKPYRSEPVNKLGCANTGVHSSMENDVFWTSALSDLVQNNINITFEFSCTCALQFLENEMLW